MKFQHLNQPPNEFDYHVARADIRQADDVIRTVAYGATQEAAETVLLAAIPPTADILDMGSV